MIWSGDLQHGMLIARAACTSFDPDVDRCISRLDADGRFLGGFIFTGYTGTMIMTHMAGVGGHWCSPLLMWTIFDWTFEQLGVKKVVCTVGSSNVRALDLVTRAGFEFEHAIKDGIPNGDLILFSMLKDNCRWLRLRSRFLKVNGSHRGEHVHA